MRFDYAKSVKPSKIILNGKCELAKTTDGKIFVIGFMDTRTVYFLDTVFGYTLTEVSRRHKGQKD